MIGHGFFLRETEVRVPLIIKFPHNKYYGLRIQSLVELIDIMPTVLDWLGILNEDDAFQGMSLLGIITGRTEGKAFAFGSSSNLNYIRYVVSNKWKYIESLKREPGNIGSLYRKDGIDYLFAGEHLYNISSDPQEKRNYYDEQEVIKDEMLEKLSDFTISNEEFRKRYLIFEESAEASPLDEELAENLRALGYLQ